MSYDRIGEIFNEFRHCVMIKNNKNNKMPKFDGKPPKLNENQLENVLKIIFKA